MGSGLLNYKMNIKFLRCVLNIELFLKKERERLFTDLFIVSSSIFDAR